MSCIAAHAHSSGTWLLSPDLNQLSFHQIEGPIHSSNVMLYSKEKSVASRVGHKFLEDGTKVRYLIKTGEVIDSVEKWVKVFKEGDSE